MIANLIIGSGPSGICAAHALANKGEKVTILDAGYSLERDRYKIIENISVFSVTSVAKMRNRLNSLIKFDCCEQEFLPGFDQSPNFIMCGIKLSGGNKNPERNLLKINPGAAV